MSICDLTLEEADIIAEKICFKDDLDCHVANLKAARVTKEVLEESKLMDVIAMQIERRIEEAISLKQRFDNILAGGEDQVNKMFEAAFASQPSKPDFGRTNSLNDDDYTTEEDYSDTEFDKIDNQLKMMSSLKVNQIEEEKRKAEEYEDESEDDLVFSSSSGDSTPEYYRNYFHFIKIRTPLHQSERGEYYGIPKRDLPQEEVPPVKKDIPAKAPAKRKAPVKRSPVEKKSFPPTKKPKKVVEPADKEEEAAKDLLRSQVAKLLTDIQQKSVTAASVNDIVEKIDWAKRKAAKAGVNTDGKTKGRGRPKKMALEMPEAFPVVRTGPVNGYSKLSGEKKPSSPVKKKQPVELFSVDSLIQKLAVLPQNPKKEQILPWLPKIDAHLLAAAEAKIGRNIGRASCLWYELFFRDFGKQALPRGVTGEKIRAVYATKRREVEG